MRPNEKLEKDVQDEINWSLFLKAKEISATAEDAVIKLIVFVDSYSKKLDVNNDLLTGL